MNIIDNIATKVTVKTPSGASPIEPVVMWQKIETIPYGEFVLVTDGDICACARYTKTDTGYIPEIAGVDYHSHVKILIPLKGFRTCWRMAKWWSPVPMLPSNKRDSELDGTCKVT